MIVGWAWKPNRCRFSTTGTGCVIGLGRPMIESASASLSPRWSLAVTVNGKVPAVVSIPLIRPAALSASPGGRAVPLARAKVTVPVPPVAESSWLQETPTVPTGGVVGLIMTGGQTTSVRLTLAVASDRSLAWTLKA
jgi:hypothetical protein